jgi:hypothetical protein
VAFSFLVMLSICLFQLKLLLKVKPKYLACCTCFSSLS